MVADNYFVIVDVYLLLLAIISDYYWLILIILLWYVSVVYINGGLEQKICCKCLEN